MTEIHPFPPVIFKENFQFKDVHLRCAREILSGSQYSSHLEKGNAQSSISNQNTAPHVMVEFEDFFSWLTPVATDIITNKLKLSERYSYYVGNSWVNVHRLNGLTVEHNHGLSALSIVAYLKLPENSGYTEFKDPYFNFRSLHEQNDLLLKEWFSVPVIEGDVLFFPGWLPHRSGPNNNIKERWVLSANFINFTLTEPYTLQNFIKL